MGACDVRAIAGYRLTLYVGLYSLGGKLGPKGIMWAHREQVRSEASLLTRSPTAHRLVPQYSSTSSSICQSFNSSRSCALFRPSVHTIAETASQANGILLLAIDWPLPYVNKTILGRSRILKAALLFWNGLVASMFARSLAAHLAERGLQ